MRQSSLSIFTNVRRAGKIGNYVFRGTKINLVEIKLIRSKSLVCDYIRQCPMNFDQRVYANIVQLCYFDFQ